MVETRRGPLSNRLFEGPVFFRADAHDSFERPVEIGDVVKTGFVADI